MPGSDDTQYKLAILMSGISMVAWIGVPVLGLYTLYVALTGGSVTYPALYTVGSLVAGVVFARLERYFQPEDWVSKTNRGS
ncbi:hypothetical protein OB955_09185 [Halobacteria archaeon AArc-m2/3/4]|uniref:Uncharacterized protein n=1 Tax=Natronoglomus mannanivorans TaxID=2979990 RepID=A0AAP2Z187_9EURY|nr:hypothetical protein [Halobacteria archaeon AArc-xg1-1]MCU4972915.1 hypothetical protein [Halobacteria archaeon AArc-m2/3/4]